MTITMIFTALDCAQMRAYRQLDTLEEICRQQDREYAEPLQAKRELCEAVWRHWQFAMQLGWDLSTPDVENLTWSECVYVDALYRAQQH